MEPKIKASIRSRYWAGESLATLARDHHQAIGAVEVIAQRDGWVEAREIIDQLKAELAAAQAEAREIIDDLRSQLAALQA